jgi:hypothetical protein
VTPEDLMRDYEAALATQDWAQVEPLLHPDVCVTFSDGNSFRGRDGVGQAFSRGRTLARARRAPRAARGAALTANEIGSVFSTVADVRRERLDAVAGVFDAVADTREVKLPYVTWAYRATRI